MCVNAQNGPIFDRIGSSNRAARDADGTRTGWWKAATREVRPNTWLVDVPHILRYNYDITTEAST